MNELKVKQNIRLYSFFQALREPLFWGPIIIFFIQHVAGMSLSDIYVMEAVVVLLIFMFEVPTGALADVIGRKKTILVGSLLLTLDTVMFALAAGPAMIWTANIIWAIGFSLVSGADSSFLYDSLAAIGQTERFKKIQGRSRSYCLLLIAFGSIATGYLATVDLRLPVLLGIPGLLIMTLVVLWFKEPPRSNNGYSVKQHWNLMKLSVLFVVNSKRVKWIIAFVVLISVVSKIWFFTYNPYFELVGLRLEYFGWIFFGMNLIAAIFSFGADWISKKVPIFTSLVLMIALNSIPILLMALFASLPMVLLVLFENVVRGYISPFTDHFLHDQLEAENRATVLSIQSAVRGLAHFIFLGLFGLALNVISLLTCLLLLGIATSLVGLYLLMLYKKVFRSRTG